MVTVPVMNPVIMLMEPVRLVVIPAGLEELVAKLRVYINLLHRCDVLNIKLKILKTGHRHIPEVLKENKKM